MDTKITSSAGSGIHNFGDRGDYKNFGVTDIPVALYHDLINHLGSSAKEESYDGEDGNWWRRRTFEISELKIISTIMVQKLHGNTYFKLWGLDLSGLNPDEKDYFSSRPLLEIRAGASSDGIWAYGRGNLISDKVKISFSMDHISLENPILVLMSLIMIRAHQIASNPACLKDRYWEVHKNPGGDFTNS